MHLTVRLEGEDHPREHDVWLTRSGDKVELEVDAQELDATVERLDDGTVLVHLDDGEPLEVAFPDDDTVTIDGRELAFAISTFDPAGVPGGNETVVDPEGTVYPPMSGKLVEVLVSEGDEVEAGDELAVLEAMKMQSKITAPRSGTVLRVHAEAGQAVEDDELLFEIGDESGDEDA